MPRDYAKVSSRFWNDAMGRRIKQLGGRARLLAVFLKTWPQANMIGLYSCNLAYLADQLGWSKEETREELRSLETLGFAFYDAEREEIYLPGEAAQQIGGPLNPRDNQARAVAKLCEEFRDGPLYWKFYEHFKEAFHLPPPTDPLVGPSQALPFPLSGPPYMAPPEASSSSREQEQEQEQDAGPENREQGQEYSLSAAADGGGTEGPAIEELQEAWNATSGVRKATALSEARRKAFKARARDRFFVEHWRAALGKFPLPCFDEPDAWVPDLDWFLRSGIVYAILEGKYDWRKSDGRRRLSGSYDRPGTEKYADGNF